MKTQKFKGKLLNKDNMLVLDEVEVRDHFTFVEVGDHRFKSNKVNLLNNKDGTGRLEFEEGWKVVW
jgi:hypothetical protein